MKIAIASDHAGYRYKEAIEDRLIKLGHDVEDFGTHSPDSCNYPEFVIPAAKAVASGEYERGIVLGGSGNGEAMAANRIHGIRCAVVWNEESVKLARQHNNANMISIGERMMNLQMALDLVDVFMFESYEGGRHDIRIWQIDEMSK
ncbi:MAG: RpiB/LacA/LacB family sugar-phosphate isomerase [Fimbriimonadaceae bacterium]|nr:RpiB/LacA/LacB family sugar-phosphate isomerase [Fimbriimonadaceae bacterium]